MKIADSVGGGGSLVRIPQAYSAMENPSRTLGRIPFQFGGDTL